MNYDLIVIGSGPGGYTSAIRAAQLGMKVALVEKNLIGGTCLNRGCIPTKALLHCSERYREMKQDCSLGVHISGLSVDAASMYQYKDEAVQKLRGGVESLLKANQITILQGHGKITAQNCVTVDGIEYTAGKILIAAGSSPSVPPIPGAQLPGVYTSDGLLEGEPVLADSLVIIGGGVIGLEMASFYSSLDRPVVILEAKERILAQMDKEVSQNISMILKKRGIEIFTSAKLLSITQHEKGLCCTFMTKEEGTCYGDAVLIATGRKPNTEALFVETLCPEKNGPFLTVNERYETSIPGIYAVGDIIGGMQLAHEAEAEGLAAVEGMVAKAEIEVAPSCPACVYTTPEIAAVGLTAEDAKTKGIPAKTTKYIMSSNGKTVITGGERGFVKLVYHGESTVLLGATLMCERATDMITVLTLAVDKGLSLEELAKTIFPHPTYSEGIKEAIHAALGHSVHSMPTLGALKR